MGGLHTVLAELLYRRILQLSRTKRHNDVASPWPKCTLMLNVYADGKFMRGVYVKQCYYSSINWQDSIKGRNYIEENTMVWAEALLF